ncbi:YqaA family protein [Methanococcus voltae]|uniref:Membrane protein YqaA with SNARE-associated domain n=2 Tax=Methanococcus voltae TaxID=2188 RepID=A0A8J7RHL0_METVO|nr:YqaA family protein [Methanococcus voltae]MBP2172947.1 membrane protein YqaA with SNARE-associated domain [Methanococcus voltae]MBP2201997.1 membrane protein YqaA with SNARE-associated domain [Methanococcus voltae]MCS3922160.1 membrane protein YqaA with SNARE-associated domain [Methanococcus voltae PS]
MFESLVNIAEQLVLDYGYIGLFLISFTESFIQPIIPDIFLASNTLFGLDLTISVLVAIVGSVLGGYVGYILGEKLGEDAFLKVFGEKNYKRGENLFKKYGVWGVVIAGFTPVPYKVVAWLAGIFEMPKKSFLIATFVGKLPRYVLVAYFGMEFGKIFGF